MCGCRRLPGQGIGLVAGTSKSSDAIENRAHFSLCFTFSITNFANVRWSQAAARSEDAVVLAVSRANLKMRLK